MKTLRKIIKWFAIIFSIICCTLLAVQKRPFGITEKPYTDAQLTECTTYLFYINDPYVLSLSNLEYKNRINKLLNVYDYKELSKDLSWIHKNGFCAMPFKTIIIDDDLTGVNYAITLTHEILHYKYYSTNERYIEFMTFRVLFESNDPYLRKAGILHGYERLTDKDKDKDKDWCADLIIDYLIKEKE